MIVPLILFFMALGVIGLIVLKATASPPKPVDKVAAVCDRYARGEIDMLTLETELDYLLGLKTRPVADTNYCQIRPGVKWPVEPTHVQVIPGVRTAEDVAAIKKALAGRGFMYSAQQEQALRDYRAAVEKAKFFGEENLH